MVNKNYLVDRRLVRDCACCTIVGIFYLSTSTICNVYSTYIQIIYNCPLYVRIYIYIYIYAYTLEYFMEIYQEFAFEKKPNLTKLDVTGM